MSGQDTHHQPAKQPPEKPDRGDAAAQQQPAATGADELPEGLRRGERDYKRAVIAMLAAGLATFNALYYTQAILPALTHQLDITPTQAALTISAATGALAVCIVPASILSERFGRGKVLIVSAVVATALGLVLALAPNATWLIIGRGVQGAVLAVAMTWISEEIHPIDLPRVMGLYVAGTSIGGLLGRMVPSFIIDVASWRWAIGISAAMALGWALLMAKMLPYQRRFVPKRISPRSELRATVRHWANHQLAALFILGFCTMGAFVSVFNYVGFRLVETFGLPEALVGVLFLLYLTGTWSSTRAGSLATKYSPGVVLVGFAVIDILGLLALLSSWLWLTVLGLALFTAAFFALHSTASGWIGKIATHDRAEASSTYLFCYYVGSSVLGWLSGHMLHSYGWSGFVWFVCAVLLLNLAICLYLLGQQRKLARAAS